MQLKLQNFTLHSVQAHCFLQLSRNLMEHSKDFLNYGFISDDILLFVCVQNGPMTTDR